MILRKWCWLVALVVFLTNATAQNILSGQAKAALWTVGPGVELYAAFGHSALRITDPVIGFDRIYNFGTFDFTTPNFYLKFIQGDLDYFLTSAIAPEVLEEYRASHQLVVEQELNLSPLELDKLFLAMEENLLPAHAAYRYDFVRDNCTTRLRDAVARVTKVEWQPLASDHPTMRQMVRPYVADRPPIITGINLLFGSNMDYPASAEEAMFLPEDMKIAFDRGIIHREKGNQPLVGNTHILLEGIKTPPARINWTVAATYLAALLAFLAFFGKIPWPRWLDTFLFVVVALIGCFIWYLWLGTRHWVLHENWNLLWACPTHLIIWFLPQRVRRVYWKIYAVFILLAGPWVHLTGANKWTFHSEQVSFFGIKLLLAFRALKIDGIRRVA